MRYGLSIPNWGETSHPRTLAELARDAEAAGWDGFFLWDHVLFGPYPHTDPWVALVAIALQTTRLRLGTLVTPLPRRRPVKLAREAVAVDQLSDGRLILGVGIGIGPLEWDVLGEETDLKVRGVMLDEFLDVLTQLWSGQPVDHAGPHYTVRAALPEGQGFAAFLPRPVQQPRIPIWVSGMWPNKPPFRRAARWDGVVPISATPPPAGRITPDDLRELVAFVQAHRSSADPFDVIHYGETSGTDAAADTAVVAPYAAAGATWWIETLEPWRFGWDEHGPVPAEAIRARIQAGPPHA